MPEKINRGLWVALEGVDAVGKSTQSELVARRIQELGFDPVATIPEFSDSSLGREIKDIIKRKRFFALDHSVHTPVADTFHLMGDLSFQVESTVRPTRARGGIIISDRGILSLISYQGSRIARNQEDSGLNKSLKWVAGIAKRASLEPDLSLIIEIDENEMIERMIKRGEVVPNPSDLDFLRRTKSAFDASTKFTKHRVRRIDGNGSLTSTTNMIVREIMKMVRA